MSDVISKYNKNDTQHVARNLGEQNRQTEYDKLRSKKETNEIIILKFSDLHTKILGSLSIASIPCIHNNTIPSIYKQRNSSFHAIFKLSVFIYI